MVDVYPDAGIFSDLIERQERELGDARVSCEALASALDRRGPPRHSHRGLFCIDPLMVEAIGERELSAAGAPETGASRAPHRKRLAEHRTFPTILAHEDNPP
jgi:hypothetical protein